MHLAYAFGILFNAQDTDLIREIGQNSCVYNISDGPLAVDARGDKLVLSLEALGAHCVDEALDFALVR